MASYAKRRKRRYSTRAAPLGQRLVAYGLCFLVAFQAPLLQAAANRPALSHAANGVPVVNIVAPNAAGLSHNRYERFDVARPGAILNNSRENLQRSQLGGLLQGNPNLRDSAAARVIVNEVTAANRSLLAGPLEVHGAGAEVVIANPNGITCNGCGFINTPRVTLSSGRPEFDDKGALQRLVVEGGTIDIGSKGANFTSADTFALVSRKIHIGGPVTGRGGIDVLAGHNRYAYRSRSLTPLAPDGEPPRWRSIRRF